RPPTSTLFPYTTLFRSVSAAIGMAAKRRRATLAPMSEGTTYATRQRTAYAAKSVRRMRARSSRHVNTSPPPQNVSAASSSPEGRSEEHTSELQSPYDLV